MPILDVRYSLQELTFGPLLLSAKMYGPAVRRKMMLAG